MHATFRRLLPLALPAASLMTALLACACSPEKEGDPQAQQLARINRELALLEEKTAALADRLERLETASPNPPRASTTTGADTDNDTDTDNDNDSPAARPQPGSMPAPSPPPTADIVVTIAGQGFRADGAELSQSELEDLFRTRVQNTRHPKLLILAGPDAPHARVVQVIDLAKKHGIVDFALNVDARPPAAK